MNDVVLKNPPRNCYLLEVEVGQHHVNVSLLIVPENSFLSALQIVHNTCRNDHDGWSSWSGIGLFRCLPGFELIHG